MKSRRHIYLKNPLGIFASTLFTALFTVGILFGIKIGKSHQQSSKMRVKRFFIVNVL
jgi:hypothetical protein